MKFTHLVRGRSDYLTNRYPSASRARATLDTREPAHPLILRPPDRPCSPLRSSSARSFSSSGNPGARHRLVGARRRSRSPGNRCRRLGRCRSVWEIVWDATFTFVALIVISLVLDEAEFFRLGCAPTSPAGAEGNGRRLFPLVVVLGAAIAAVFANDGAALLLTPIVLAILLRLDFPPAAALAFVVACGFVADTTSLPLVVSNLVNIVTANFFDVSFGRYAAVMVPVSLVSLAATLLVLWAFFRKGHPGDL